jgi:Tc5 transposase DNA-binding domain
MTCRISLRRTHGACTCCSRRLWHQAQWQPQPLDQTAFEYEVPRSTLNDQWNGTPTRKEGHVHELLPTPAQEEVLVKWIKVMGRRGIPMTTTMIIDHVADIIGHATVGELWVKRFKARHPELKVKWSSTLEKCCAASLNPVLVNEFYDLLEDVIKEYGIPAENIYNMDEKGIQLGVGQKVKAFVDRDQKDVYSVENGNRELVTVIETVCADGSCLQPSVIYQGKRRDLEWGRNNTCNARYVCHDLS